MSTGTNMKSKPPKAMSSRLLTMKFMQRAAASSPVPSPSTPDVPSAKRRKTGEPSPSGFEIDALADQRAVEAALATEEAIREAALERAGADAGDTRWVINFEQDRKSAAGRKPTLQVVQTGFASIDSGRPGLITARDVEEEQRPTMVGRRSFGKFNRAIEKLQNPEAESSDSDSGSDDDNADRDEDEDSEQDFGRDQDDEAQDLIREAKSNAAEKLKGERKKKRKAAKKEAQALAEKRKKKEVNLNGLTSLSGVNTPSKQACHKCGQVGHLQANCPKKGRDRGDDRDDRSRKSRKSM